MSLTPGTKFGAYDVVSSVGAGGMGEVYRARDARLGRDVAIKILPAAFAEDPERLARFEREARTLASLNHPNIATIHGFESQGAVRALVMELVDGLTLEQVIAARKEAGLPTEEVLPIARQIVLALEAAHEAGITHRDLKPANVKIRPDGTVKLLDFGLAKAGPSGSEDPGLHPSQVSMNSPTLTAQATAAGMILGTAAYMSPEQARGRPVDRRADIWAFGCVLFEMLTGRRPFGGEDISETLASVIKDEPAWGFLPSGVPESIRRLLRRCLEKDPRKRLSAIGDARFDLDEQPAAAPAAQAPAPAPKRRSLAVSAVIGGGLAVAVLASLALWAGWFRAAAATPLMRVTVQAPPGHSVFRDPANMAMSPDGRKIAFVTGISRQGGTLWIRQLDKLESQAVQDSTGAQLPFWSPDSQKVGFFARGKLRVVDAQNGRPQDLADAPDGRGATWGRNGDIVFAASNAGPLSRVSQNGGAVAAATELATAQGETGHRFPSFLPDGDHFLFAAMPGKAAQFEVSIGSISSRDRQRLLSAETAPFYSEPGFLLYTRGGVLLAHPFDAGRRAFTGEAVPLGDTPGEMNLEYSAGAAGSSSTTGALAYLTASQQRSRLVWLDPGGRETGAVDVPLKPYAGVSLSPDGLRAILIEPASPRAALSLVDVVRGGLTPMASTDSWNYNPVWGPDSRRFVFGSDRSGPTDIYLRRIDDPDDKVAYKSPDLFKWPVSWSHDGKHMLFTVLDPKMDNDLWSITPGEDKPPVPVLRTPANDAFGTISPDGRWLAYISNKAGAFDVYVQSFPTPGDTTRITTGGTLDWGVWWKKDASQLLILDANLKLLLVDVKTSPSFSASPPRAVGQLRFQISGQFALDAAPDFSRLLAVVPELVDGARSMTVVLNWRGAIAR